MTERQPDPTSPQDIVNRLVNLADAERGVRQAHTPPRERPSRDTVTRLALMITAPLLVVVVALNFGGPLLTSLFETPLPAADARAEAQQTLSALVDDIERFRENYDELPESLVEIGVPRGSWTYALVQKDGYRIQGVVDGQEVTFESSTRTGAR